HFQFSSGTNRCSQCHFAPAGGGLLSEWGRVESADTLSRGGNGDFLHGLVSLPDSLQLGGDVRLAALVNDVGASEGAEYALFPMQLDASARLRRGKWSVVATIGHRGSVREADLQDGSLRSEAGLVNALISREHYISWRPKRRGPYVRAGRFYAPFGLRLPDHTSFVRRHLGFNLLEETYGISAGFVKRQTELHVTAFISDRLRWSPRNEFGGVAMMEWRREKLAYGLSSRVVAGEGDVRVIGGGFAKLWSPGIDVLWMAELDGAWQRFGDAASRRWQAAGYAGPVWFPTKGLSVAAAYEFYDQDVIAKHVERHGLTMWVSFLPRAHFEIMLSGRAQLVGSSDQAMLGLLQLHYYP
ncbi:MAG: OprO/OprP family phosphate-selective porin, partial [Gammaproteobacteria bacterium]|nr:OprO/OprP family phosphate-selective porin [Gammaproteobacteria bacterium]